MTMGRDNFSIVISLASLLSFITQTCQIEGKTFDLEDIICPLKPNTISTNSFLKNVSQPVFDKSPGLLHAHIFESLFGLNHGKNASTRICANVNELSTNEHAVPMCPSSSQIDKLIWNKKSSNRLIAPSIVEPDVIKNQAECSQTSERTITTVSNLSVSVKNCTSECVYKLILKTKPGYNILVNITSVKLPDVALLIDQWKFHAFPLKIFLKTQFSDDQLVIGREGMLPHPASEVVLLFRLSTICQCEGNIIFNAIIAPCRQYLVSDPCKDMKLKKLNENEGYIISPVLDTNAYYPNIIECSKKITIPKNKFIKFTFNTTRVLGVGDVLTVIPENLKGLQFPQNINYTLRYQRQLQTKPIVLPSNRCTVTFLSRNLKYSNGFNLIYTAVNEEEFIPTFHDMALNCSFLDSIPDSLRCDIHHDCYNHEDERNCSYRPQSCGASGYYYKNHCYHVIDNFLNHTWIDAENICKGEYNARIISINTVGERKFIHKLLQLHNDQKPLFFGLKRIKRNHVPRMYRRLWQWSDGSIGLLLPRERHWESWDSCSIFYPNQQFFEATPCLRRWSNATVICERKLNDKDNVAVYLNRNNSYRGQVEAKLQQYTFECLSGEYIAQELLCNGEGDCFDMSDEHEAHCKKMGVRADIMYKCRIGIRIPYTFVCDGVNDCYDNSDETFCARPFKSELPNGTLMCKTGMILDKNRWCDGIDDCPGDASDENGCMECSGNAFYCPLFHCLPKEWHDDSEIDCPVRIGIDTPVLESDFVNFSPPREPPGIVFPDGYGKVSIKRIGIEDDCPNTHFQCYEGFCVPVYMLCNGYKDCPYGEDENTYVCENQCKGLYKCKHHLRCIHASHLCNSVYECPLKDDELICTAKNLSCPAGCTCKRLEFTCKEIPNFNESVPIRYLDISFTSYFDVAILGRMLYLRYTLIVLNVSGNGIENLNIKGNHFNFHNLKTLDASFNKIKFIANDAFKYCYNIEALHLAWNNIKGSQLKFLQHIRRLTMLDLSHNVNTELGADCFGNAKRLQELLLQDMGILKIHENTFRGLIRLNKLDLRGNEIIKFSANVFKFQQNLGSLTTDNFRLCCDIIIPASLKKENCIAPLNEVSSCIDLLRSMFLRVSLWVMAVLTIIGNVGVIAFRIFVDHSQRKNFSIIVASLATSDLIMGIYLVIIGAADAYFRDEFILYEEKWKSCIACKISGYVCLLSTEVSAMLILAVTIDRLLVIALPLHRKFHLTSRSASVVSGVVWLIGLSIASVPLLPSFQNWNLYSQRSMGVPLPITRNVYPGFRYTFAVFIILNSFIFVLVVVGQILIYLAVTRRPRLQTTESRMKQETALAKHLALVVITDCFCWFPLTVMGILAMSGVHLPSDIHVITTVFLLPANSALNPFLYTLNASFLKLRERKKRKKRIPPSTS